MGFRRVGRRNNGDEIGEIILEGNRWGRSRPKTWINVTGENTKTCGVDEVTVSDR